MELTAIDFETTGSVRGFVDEPWQIGLVRFDLHGDGPLDGFGAWLHVDAGRPFNPYAPGRHAEVRAELAAAPTFQERWPELAPRLACGQPLVAHNAATERKFLSRLAPLTSFGPWIDTLAIARKAFPSLAAHTLADVVAAAGVLDELQALFPGRTWHDALFDAAACAVFLRWLARQPGWERMDAATLERMSR